MNVLAIADLFVPAHVMRGALVELAPSRLDVIDWPNRDAEQLHHRVRRIEQLGPAAEEPPDAAWELAADADLIVTHMAPIPAELIRRAARLSMIGVCRAGVENVDCAEAERRGVTVYNVPGRNAVAVAEFTIGLILAECRNIGRAHASLAAGGWRKHFSNEQQDTELSGKTIGLVGFGLVGQSVAERLHAFGIKLLVHDPYQPAPRIERCLGQAVSLEELLRESDVVSLHARLPAGQPPLIGAQELSWMKPAAYLINTARAHLVDAGALVEALRQGRIAGAAIDVFEREPLAPDDALRGLDNVTLTPHLAGSTREAFHNSVRMLVDRIKQHGQ